MLVSIYPAWYTRRDEHHDQEEKNKNEEGNRQTASAHVELTAKAVQSAALALQCIDNVQCGDGLAAGVLGVGDGIADDVLQEHLQRAARLLVDEAADALDTAAASETPDGGLRDTLQM